jgi:hypothetical protein
MVPTKLKFKKHKIWDKISVSEVVFLAGKRGGSILLKTYLDKKIKKNSPLIKRISSNSRPQSLTK